LPGVAAAVEFSVVPGMLNGQDTGLVQRDILQGLARRVELELIFVFLFRFFGHNG
jgi:hypothetical protein